MLINQVALMKLNTAIRKAKQAKRIWSKGFILVEENNPILIRGIVRDVTDNFKASKQNDFLHPKLQG